MKTQDPTYVVDNRGYECLLFTKYKNHFLWENFKNIFMDNWTDDYPRKDANLFISK